MHRRTLLSTIGAAVAAGTLPKAWATTVGVTATEIKIGHTIPYSGPASAYGVIGQGHTAFFKMLNENGGIAGRKINFISLDDGYLPPKTVEQVRRLVEQDQVAFLFNTLGTPNNTAIQKYVNQKKVPHLFLATGADKWGNYKEFPWTIGWQPSYRTEAQIYAKYITLNHPNAKIAVLYQNDDFGKDYLIGLKDALGADYGKLVVKEASYEVTDATIDSQAVSFQASGADVLVTAATPKFAAQTIRKVYDLGWKPLHFMTNVSASVGAVITPAGPEKAVGVITSQYAKDPTEPTWKDDPGMNEWRGFMKKYLPDADLSDSGYVFSYGVCNTLLQVLKQCGDDFSRENIMKQATNLKDLEIPTLLPGIKVNTSPTNYHPIRQMQLAKWNGKTWELFGSVIEGAGT
ncbi:ABC transporter substrate-binding protein [Limobrevibacterium gyesilva]|uniref:ABC transporter substrate-binding protein n=1 Tax=Limobrevibacterium gyesilva TaxID=2991712 RepID=A0AA41YN96_9PROT|nr:ABC transporter substrate-binding protein [Limobrevibacterium gyesilva]MCW3475492.1 ABC transporter substrate-binding protein [Limobrevibacterium gyesilva]